MSSKVAEQIKALKELQEIDRQIRDIERAKQDLPQRRASLQQTRERERADLTNAAQLVTRNDTERMRLEKEIKFDQEALARFEERAKDVTSPDAFAAASRELETRRKSIKEKEDTIVRLMEEKEVLQKKSAQIQAEFVKVDEQHATEEKQLEGQNAEVDQKTVGLRKQRAEMASHVEKSLLSRYDQIFKRRDGVAIVAVKGEVCTGCDMGVPPQIVNFVRSGEAGIQTCPHCSRILVWEPREAPEEKPKRKRASKKKTPGDDGDEDADEASAE